MTEPAAEEQLEFLSRLQRLFAEGDFTATYKYALLCALADLAVECGADDVQPLTLRIRQIGERFIRLYWQHCAPYGSGNGEATGILIQNHGAQAAVISAIRAFRERTGIDSLERARRHSDFLEVVKRVSQTVSAQPIKYLQNFGGTTERFLYERTQPGYIRLLPGVAFCLRRFYPLIQQLARAHWLDHIKANRQNQPIIGKTDDLESFLFEPSRQSLQRMGDGLRKLDGDRCFYCGGPLKEADVDHFIPFARYPRDLAHNFILAHPVCNRSKSDTLAARVHLERWLERMARHGHALAEMGADAGFVADAGTTTRVGHWAYTSAVAAEAMAWVAPKRYQPVDADYLACF